MGKSEKPRTTISSGYPYAPVRVPAPQVSKSKLYNEQEQAMGMYAMGNQVFSPREQISRTDMKHLEFLRAISQHYFEKISQVYASGCSLLPASCRSGLRNLEDRVGSISSPLLQGSERVLLTLDRKVDSVYELLAQRKGEASSTQQHPRLEESAQYLRENGLTGLARHAMSMVMSRDGATETSSMDPQALRDSPDQHKSWSQYAMSPVSRVLESAEPGIKYTQQVYGEAHKAIISSDAYSSAVDTANEMLQRLQETAIYKASARRLYPAISGIADPALEKLLKSEYAKAFVDHLKPLPKPPGEAMPVMLCATC